MLVFVVEWLSREGQYCRDEFHRLEAALFAARAVRGAGEMGVILGAFVR